MALSLAGGKGERLLFEDVMWLESGRIVLVVQFGKDGMGHGVLWRH